MDISKLTDKELLELRKTLNNEIKKRDVSGTYKSDFLITKRLLEMFGNEVYAKDITNGYEPHAPAYFWAEKFERSILALCDLAFGNYTSRPTKSGHHTGIYLGTAILPPEIDEKKYGKMIDEILEVMKKYKKET